MKHQFSDAAASTLPQADRPSSDSPPSGTFAIGAATSRCLACDSADLQIVGDRPGAPGRFNACCERCALLQVTPGTDGVHGGSSADVPLDGELVRSRAERLAVGANIKMGDAVLGFRTHGAQLLRVLDELFGIDGHVVYDAAFPNRMPPRATVFTENVKAYEPPVRFDAILALNVAQTWPDPLGTMLHLRHLLKPTGTLVVEVPNVLPSGEFEPGAFLSPGTESSFSLNTVRLLLLRTGFLVDVATAGRSLVLSCRHDPETRALPIPFRADMLRYPEQTGEWLLSRLASYVTAEQARDDVLSGQTDIASARVLLDLLRQPAFDDHLLNVVVEVVQAYAEAGAFQIGRMIASAAAANAPARYRGGLQQLVDALG